MGSGDSSVLGSNEKSVISKYGADDDIEDAAEEDGDDEEEDDVAR